MLKMRQHIAVVLAALLAHTAQAADHVPPPAQRVPLLITNATLHPVGAPDIANGRLLVDRGRIVAVLAPGDALPATTTPPQVLDLGGRHVYPGFVSAASAIGLVEVPGVGVTVDNTENGPVNPNARALVAINPDSELLPVARAGGVLAAHVVPQGPRGGGFAGTSALVQLEGWTWEDMALQPEAGVHLVLPTMRLADELLGPALRPLGEQLRKASNDRLREIDDALDAAAAYARALAATPEMARDTRWDALLPVMRGERPLFVHAGELAQIRHALALAQRHALKLVIVGGADAWRVADVLRERQVPVVIGGVHRLPLRREDDVDGPFALAAKLHAAGVRFAIAHSTGSGMAAHNERNLPFEAATAAAHGLPRDEALKAITLYPAQILGAAEQLGSLAPGRWGSFIVTDGDPLLSQTQIQRVFVQGREIGLDNRQTRLAEKYMQRQQQLKQR